MTSIRVEITRWVDDHQPGIVECKLTDAAGRDWLFIEKLPLVTEDDSLCASSVYPIKGLIACKVIAYIEDLSRRRIVRITTEVPWQIAALDGEMVFDVRPEQIVTSRGTSDDTD
jgi:hypothetical protein